MADREINRITVLRRAKAKGQFPFLMIRRFFRGGGHHPIRCSAFIGGGQHDEGV